MVDHQTKYRTDALYDWVSHEMAFEYTKCK